MHRGYQLTRQPMQTIIGKLIALDQIAHTPDVQGPRSKVRFTVLSKEGTQASKLSVLAYAFISRSDRGSCGSFSGL